MSCNVKTGNTRRKLDKKLIIGEKKPRYLDGTDDTPIKEGLQLYGYQTEWDFSDNGDFTRSEKYLLIITKIIDDDVYIKLERESGFVHNDPRVCRSEYYYIWNRKDGTVKTNVYYVLYYHLFYFFRERPRMIEIKEDLKDLFYI